MTKIRFWAKVELEVDTETGKAKLIKGFNQISKGYSEPKKKKSSKPKQFVDKGEAEVETR